MTSITEDLQGVTVFNYTDLLKRYCSEMEERLKSWGNLVSNVPLNDEYYLILRKYHMVVNKFKGLI